MKNKLSAIIRITVSFGLLGLLFWLMRDDISEIWGTISGSNLNLIVLGLILVACNVAMLAVRLKIIFEGEDLTVTWREALQLTYVGYYFNNFMPTAVGGDIVKAHYASQANQKRMQSYASVMMDRVIGLYTFLMVAAVALLVDRGRFNVPVIRPMVFLFVLMGIAGFIMLTNKAVARFMRNLFGRMKMLKLGEKLNSFYDIVHDYRNRLDVVGKALLISIIAQSVYFFVMYLFFIALGVPVKLGNIFLVMPVVTFISMLPSLGGLGVREGAIVTFFAPLAGKDTAFAASLLLLSTFICSSIIGGIIYLWWGISGTHKRDA